MGEREGDFWIGGDAYTAVAVAKKVGSGSWTVYNIFRDHLGTITHLKTVSTIDEYNFDACLVKLGFCERSETKTVVELIPISEAVREGRRLDKDDWTTTLTSKPALFADRGFTGHEYLEDFKLYNMNGRLYDPVAGRFLNADPVIQDAGSTQDYNRYSYCLNNPLKYNDPSGNIAYTYWRDDRSGYDGGAFNFDFSFSRHSGGGASGYFWSSGTYKDLSGRQVSWDEVLNNYVAPNSTSRGGNDVSSLVFIGTAANPYQTLLGWHYIDGSSYYYSDGKNLDMGNIDWKGVTSATIGLVGGMAEMAIGGAATYFSAGTATVISGPLMLDGGVRTIANAQRLWMHFNGNAKLANAYPTSLGALAGKGLDLAFGTSIYNVGFGQAIGVWGNDLTSFVVMGGNGAAISNLVNTPSPSSMLNYIFSVGSYPYSMYYNAQTKQ